MDRSDKREVVMQAALELVAEHGFHGAPVAMIAERAGVAAGTIYCYFENKDGLIRETYAELERRLNAAVMEQYPADRPIRERFIHMTRTVITYCITSPMEFRFLEQFHNSPFGAARRRDKIFGRPDGDFCRELFEEGLRQQIVKDLPLPVLFSLTFGPIVHLCRDVILQFIQLDEALIEQIVEACWDAVRR